VADPTGNGEALFENSKSTGGRGWSASRNPGDSGCSLEFPSRRNSNFFVRTGDEGLPNLGRDLNGFSAASRFGEVIG